MKIGTDKLFFFYKKKTNSYIISLKKKNIFIQTNFKKPCLNKKKYICVSDKTTNYI
jgi:hypothetical protein